MLVTAQSSEWRLLTNEWNGPYPGERRRRRRAWMRDIAALFHFPKSWATCSRVIDVLRGSLLLHSHVFHRLWYSTVKAIPMGEGSTASGGGVGSHLWRTQTGQSESAQCEKRMHGLHAGANSAPPSRFFVP